MPSLSPQERSRLSFFKAGPHFLPTFLTSGNLAGSFPEPSVSHRGHGSPPPTAFTARHPTDAEWSLAGTTAQASGRPQPGAGPSHARGAQASTGSRPLKPPSLVKFHDSFSLKKKKNPSLKTNKSPRAGTLKSWLRCSFLFSLFLFLVWHHKELEKQFYPLILQIGKLRPGDRKGFTQGPRPG